MTPRRRSVASRKHLRARPAPLVLNVLVEEDEKAQGLFLRFHQLSAEADEYLRSQVNFLPILAMRAPGQEDRGILLSEILDASSAPAPAG